MAAAPPTPTPGTDEALTVSVIVPAYNAAATLPPCLAPLLRMRHDGEIVDVVVVDDGSTDATAEIAVQLGAWAIDSGGRLGPGGARNAAAQGAAGNVLWFVDADVVVHDDAARVLIEAFRTTGAAAVFGAYDDRPAAANFLSQYKNLVHRHHHSEGSGAAETFWAGCGAVRKAVFLEVGGFDAARYPRPSIEDIELGWRLRGRGLSIWLTPALQGTHLKVWHLPNLLQAEIFSRALPWSRLALARGGAPATLNFSRPERLRAVLALLVFASVAPAVAGLVPWWLPVALLASALAANWKLLALFRRRRGLAFALAGGLLHQIYYLYSAAAFAWSWLEQCCGRRVGRENRAL
jgi:glycosyltransferase involved in cell wall biosynthesis